MCNMINDGDWLNEIEDDNFDRKSAEIEKLKDEMFNKGDQIFVYDREDLDESPVGKFSVRGKNKKRIMIAPPQELLEKLAKHGLSRSSAIPYLALYALEELDRQKKAISVIIKS